MEAKSKTFAVIIGRFQPLHNGHTSLIKKATDIANNVIILIGSANQPRTPYNPFTWRERAEIIHNYIETDPYFADWHNLDNSECQLLPLNDYKYNDLDWVEEVQDLVNQTKYEDSRVVVVGHHKDEATSYYLDMFPQWEYIEVKGEKPPEIDAKKKLTIELEATIVRKMWFEHYEMELPREEPISIGNLIKQQIINQNLEMLLPDTSYKFLKEFEYDFRDQMNSLVDEFIYYREYPKQWGKGPFVTVDAAVFCCGHILLIRRGEIPGKGLYALPGGFLNNDEFIPTGIIRELKEETKIKIPIPVLHGSMKHIEVFADPKRSLRGRLITHCGLINLRNEKELPEVRGADDADRAIWVPISDFVDNYRWIMFEDHYDIVIRMKSLVK
jgi:bifunctional NMN adenylyltransferase/nudix hydrolase